MESDACVESSSDERVPQAVRRDPLVDPGALHQSFDHPIGAEAVHASAFDAEEDWPHRPFTDVEIECSTGAGFDPDRDCLPPLRTIANV